MAQYVPRLERHHELSALVYLYKRRPFSMLLASVTSGFLAVMGASHRRHSFTLSLSPYVWTYLLWVCLSFCGPYLSF